MKTKLLLLAALAALTVYSCTSERSDEEIQTRPLEKVQKINKNITSKTESDTVRIYNSTFSPPNNSLNPDPSEGGDPTTITPPRR